MITIKLDLDHILPLNFIFFFMVVTGLVTLEMQWLGYGPEQLSVPSDFELPVSSFSKYGGHASINVRYDSQSVAPLYRQGDDAPGNSIAYLQRKSVESIIHSFPQIIDVIPFQSSNTYIPVTSGCHRLSNKSNDFEWRKYFRCIRSGQCDFSCWTPNSWCCRRCSRSDDVCCYQLSRRERKQRIL